MEIIKQLLKYNDRLRDYYEVGPVQRAAVEDFADLLWEDAYQKGFDNGFEQSILRERG